MNYEGVRAIDRCLEENHGRKSKGIPCEGQLNYSI